MCQLLLSPKGRKAAGKLQERSGTSRRLQASIPNGPAIKACEWKTETENGKCLGQYVKLRRDLGQIFFHMGLSILCQVVLVLKSADVSQSTPEPQVSP